MPPAKHFNILLYRTHVHTPKAPSLTKTTEEPLQKLEEPYDSRKVGKNAGETNKRNGYHSKTISLPRDQDKRGTIHGNKGCPHTPPKINLKIRPPRDRNELIIVRGIKGYPTHQNHLQWGVLDNEYLGIRSNAQMRTQVSFGAKERLHLKRAGKTEGIDWLERKTQ